MNSPSSPQTTMRSRASNDNFHRSISDGYNNNNNNNNNAIDYSARSNDNLPLPSSRVDLSSLSNRIGVPRGQSSRKNASRRQQQQQRRASENVIDWSARSDDVVVDQRPRRRQSRRDSGVDKRRSSHSLEDVPEERAYHALSPQQQKQQQRKRADSDPSLSRGNSNNKTDPALRKSDPSGRLNDSQENLYEEVLMDFFAKVAQGDSQNEGTNDATRRRSCFVTNTKTMEKNRSNESWGTFMSNKDPPRTLSMSNDGMKMTRSTPVAARRNSSWDTVQWGASGVSNPPNRLRRSGSSQEGNDQIPYKQQRRNSVMPPSSTAAAAEKLRMRNSRSIDNFLDVAGINKPQQRSNSRGSDNLDESLQKQQQPRRSSMVKPGNVAVRNSRSSDNLDEAFQQQQRRYYMVKPPIRNSRSSDNLDEAFQQQQRRYSMVKPPPTRNSRSSENLLDAAFNQRQKQQQVPNVLKGEGNMSKMLKLVVQIEQARQSNNPEDQERIRNFASQIQKLRRESEEDRDNSRNKRTKNKDDDERRRSSNELSNSGLSSGDDMPRLSNASGRSGTSGERRQSMMNGKRTNGDLHRLKLFDNLNAAVDPASNNTTRNEKPKMNQLKRLDSSDRKTTNEKPFETDKQKMKLYDELLSASNTDRKTVPPISQGGTASTAQTTPHHPLLDSSLKSIRSFRSKTQTKARRCGPHRKKDKKLLFALVLLLLGLVGGYLVFQYAPGLRKTIPSNNDPADEVGDIDEESSVVMVSPTLSSANNDTNGTIQSPPSDIGGMCSVSNLPGSLSACLSACLPSACCYPGYTGESCLDESNPDSQAACSAYRPHCDVFYDVWLEGTEGVLRVVTEDMVKTCNGAKNIVISNEASSIGTASTGVKRLRGHQSGESRHLVTTSAQETCYQYCASAKCCSAPVIAFPEKSGLDLSPTGVFTNASSGEYVITSCQASNSKNIELCTQYEAFCTNDEMNVSTSQTVTSVPNLSSNVSSRKPLGSPTVTIPVPKPTSSQTPAQVPIVSSMTNDSTLNTSPPSSTSNNAIVSSNQPSKATSVVDNQASKEPTSTDVAFSNQTAQVPVSTINKTDDSGNLSSVNASVSLTPSQSPIPVTGSQSPNTVDASTATTVVVPPASTAEIEEACSSNKAVFLITTGDVNARSQCINACREGACCFTTQLGYFFMESCYEGNERVCNQDYSPCLILQDEDTNDTGLDDSNATIVSLDNSTTGNFTIANSSETLQELSQNANITANGNDTVVRPNNETDAIQITGPPTPEQDLAKLCSEMSIAQTSGLKNCIKACDLGSCCSATDETECLSTHSETCDLYTPCINAYNLLYSD